MPTTNKLQRELERRIRAFRKRTGGDFASVWIAPGDWLMLPEELRSAALGGALRGAGPPYITLAGVPVRHYQLLDPV